MECGVRTQAVTSLVSSQQKPCQHYLASTAKSKRSLVARPGECECRVALCRGGGFPTAWCMPPHAALAIWHAMCIEGMCSRDAACSRMRRRGGQRKYQVAKLRQLDREGMDAMLRVHSPAQCSSSRRWL